MLDDVAAEGPAARAGRPTAALRFVQVAELAWLTGEWYAELEGDEVEEHWMAPAGGTMPGMFRWLRDGQPRFYELLLLEPDGDELALLIRHFHPALRGWDRERDGPTRFVLCHLDGERAIFVERNVPDAVWLTYQRDGDRLEAIFERDGEPYDPDGTFRYRLT